MTDLGWGSRAGGSKGTGGNNGAGGSGGAGGSQSGRRWVAGVTVRRLV
ncbi:hypothetical protein ABZT17_02035 [Streptomyces sp. NPDC005648]